MLVIGLDGKEYQLKLTEKTVDDSRKSNLHLKARALIKEIFPYDILREEVALPGTKTVSNRGNVIADFFLPNRSIIVEVDGCQHDTYNKFFHKNKMNFIKAKARDANKAKWCDLNGITLIKLKHNESIDVWRSKF